ncbi:hypothetical protein F442_04639 [Phytophthora nicotianae P10297]|uniref:Uncharacterized protein n=2 Tax=Phytophthora nicotianae TaxID=4792 RepID=V9FL93_PHYNI|nr:hypothetical protein F443_04590 [Phytophthora nicotianae P1569]ETP49930.1 hypothetical protein F442_04639 [Phytophthora nicotianae P10297]
METRSACSSKAHAQRQYYDKLSNLQFQVSSLESQYDQLLKTFRRLDVPPVNGIDKVNTKQKALACILRRVHKQLKMMRSALREETTRVICVRTTCTAASTKTENVATSHQESS